MFNFNARYGITEVRHNSSHIVRLKVLDTARNATVEMTREYVVSLIKQGYRFKTLPKDRNGRLYWGEDVRIFTFLGVAYLRTDTNRVASDNLGELPAF